MKKVNPGDKFVIPANTYNAFIDAARWAQEQGSLKAGIGLGKGESGIVIARNDVGADVGRFGVMGLGDAIITPTANANEFKSRVTFVGEIPVVEDHANKFCVAQEPIKDGEYGKAMISGITAVQIDVQESDDIRAGVADGDYSKLTSGTPHGVEILYKESGTGTKWAYVRLGRLLPNSGLAIAKADISSDAVGNVALVRADAGETEIGDTFSARNKGDDVSSGDPVIFGIDDEGAAFFLAASGGGEPSPSDFYPWYQVKDSTGGYWYWCGPGSSKNIWRLCRSTDVPTDPVSSAGGEVGIWFAPYGCDAGFDELYQLGDIYGPSGPLDFNDEYDNGHGQTWYFNDVQMGTLTEAPGEDTPVPGWP